jgi:hypothetical protein
MSAFGTKLTFCVPGRMSAFRCKADISHASPSVCFRLNARVIFGRSVMVQ